MKKSAYIIGVLIVAILILSIFKAFASNRISTSGLALGEIKDRLNTLKIENTLLSEKLYSLSSLSNVSIQADRLGFIEGKSKFVLINPIPIAIKQ